MNYRPPYRDDDTRIRYIIDMRSKTFSVRQSSLAYHGPRGTKKEKVKSKGRTFKKKKSEASVNAAAFSEENTKVAVERF